MAPPPSGGDSAGALKNFVYADTPVEEVRASIDGRLRGPARAAAEAAAQRVRDARTLGGLDRSLRAEALIGSGDVVAEVSTGPRRGVLCVAFRPAPMTEGTWSAGAHTGLDEGLDSALRFRVQHAAPAADGGPPIRLGFGGLFNVGRSAGLASLQITPPLTLVSGWAPSIEIGLSAANVAELLGPQQQATHGALSLNDSSGRHSLRLQTSAREVLPGDHPSPSLMQAEMLQNTKASLGYRYLCDTRLATDASSSSACMGTVGTLRAASAEVAGFFGDVALARAECAWMRSTRAFGNAFLTCSAAGGFALPLAACGSTSVPLEDRFFLGGTFGQSLGERLPGFAAHGTGPADVRPGDQAGPDSSSAEKTELRTVFRFGRDWQTERRLEHAAVLPSKEEEVMQPPVDRLGGTARASVAATLHFPMPILSALNLRGFVTGTAASLVGEVRPSLLADLKDQGRASIAGGLAAALPGGGLLGVSYAQPLLARGGDELRRWQMWLSFGNVL